MAYAESKREKILRYLEENTLQLIDGDEPYNFDVGMITRNFVYPEDLRNDQFPAVVVLDDFVTRYSQMTASEYTTGVSIDKIDGPNEGMQVGIAGYVKLRTPGDKVLTGELSTEMNKMHSDMVIAMHKDITLGGNCLGLAMTSSQNSLEFIQNGNFGVVQQMYSIKYDFQPSSNIT